MQQEILKRGKWNCTVVHHVTNDWSNRTIVERESQLWYVHNRRSSSTWSRNEHQHQEHGTDNLLITVSTPSVGPKSGFMFNDNWFHIEFTNRFDCCWFVESATLLVQSLISTLISCLCSMSSRLNWTRSRPVLGETWTTKISAYGNSNSKFDKCMANNRLMSSIDQTAFEYVWLLDLKKTTGAHPKKLAALLGG